MRTDLRRRLRRIEQSLPPAQTCAGRGLVPGFEERMKEAAQRLATISRDRNTALREALASGNELLKLLLLARIGRLPDAALVSGYLGTDHDGTFALAWNARADRLIEAILGEMPGQATAQESSTCQSGDPFEALRRFDEMRREMTRGRMV
jgi:hypothetical protein